MNEEGELVQTIKRFMKVAKLDSDKELVNEDSGVLFWDTRYSIPYLAKIDEKGNELERVQFPEKRKDTIYIVSGIFRFNYDRSDLWQPGELVRNDKGQPIGCIGLSC